MRQPDYEAANGAKRESNMLTQTLFYTDCEGCKTLMLKTDDVAVQVIFKIPESSEISGKKKKIHGQQLPLHPI